MTRFIFVLWCLMILSVSVFGQTLDADLKNSFNKYSIVKIDDQDALKKAKNQQPFKFKVDDKTFQFILIPNEIRSEKYKTEYIDKYGRHSLPKGEVFTYKGTLIGEKDSVLAFTVDGKITEGFFIIGQDAYYLEAAKKYSSKANNEDKVIYQTKDKVKKDDLVCGLDEAVAGELKRTNSSVMSAPTSSTEWDGIKIIELATEADYQWVMQFGGNAQSANNYILSVINGVNVIYRRDLKLTIQVTSQIAWITPDPYRTGDISITLQDFIKYWNDNYPYNQFPRDLAHLFTGKYNGTGLSAGGVVCKDPSNSYGLSGYSNSLNSQIALTAHEIGHNLGGNHVASSGDCTNTIMNQIVGASTTKFCLTSRTEIKNFITSNGGCLALEPAAPRTLYDFDADGKADISVFRPSNTTWYIEQSTAGFYTYPFGNSTDKVAPADYDNDGKTDIAVFRPSDGFWYWINSSNGGFNAVQLGTSGDIPVPGDFSGDRQAELVVFRPSNGVWYTLNLVNSQVGAIQFGTSGDKPLIGDFDKDGKNDYAVFRPSDTNWYILGSTQGLTIVQFGNATDLPVPADYDGDLQTDIAVFRPSTIVDDTKWFILGSTQGFLVVPFGAGTDKPTPADYDGDGKADISVFRPSTGAWYRINSSTNAFVGIQFGASEDIPIPGFNVVQQLNFNLLLESELRLGFFTL